MMEVRIRLPVYLGWKLIILHDFHACFGYSCRFRTGNVTRGGRSHHPAEGGHRQDDRKHEDRLDQSPAYGHREPVLDPLAVGVRLGEFDGQFRGEQVERPETDRNFRDRNTTPCFTGCANVQMAYVPHRER